MEFLNGLRAQLLKLLVGKVCQQAEGCSLYNLLLLACGFSFLLAESKLLRQKAQDTGLWQSVSHSPVYMDYYNYFFGGGEAGDAFKRSFYQEVELFCQSEIWLILNHFIGREGKCSIDH